MRIIVPAAMLLVLVTAPVSAQTQSTGLATIFRDVFGPNGLVVNSEAVLPDGSTHSAHFNSGFQSEFTQFNVAIASQLTAVPLPSPASGFTYRFDPATGTFARSTQSFGPILTERSETIGRGKLSFGFNYQFFSFDSLEGLDLTRVPAVFSHDDFQLGGGRADVVTTVNSVRASVKQLTGSITYGLTDRLDIALAVPMVTTNLAVLSNATIQRIGTTDPDIHFFRDPDAVGGFGNHKQFFAEGSASGIGDVIVRVKAAPFRRAQSGVAMGLDVRLPSGDEENLLGSGAAGVKPFVAASTLYKRLAPHINLAYQWNGKSVLAGDVSTGRKGDLPDEFLYAIGADMGVTDRFTLAVDLLGEWVIDSPRLIRRQFNAVGPATSIIFDDIGFESGSFNAMNGSVGFKTNVAGRLLVNFNLRFKLDDSGLRDRVTPLLGFEYGF